MGDVIVRKLNLDGQEVYTWTGRVLARGPASVTLEAFFTRAERLDLGYTVFERGDRFVEHYYVDRWYNVFEVRAAGTDALRGWYCNITRPAVIEDRRVSAVDLALDVWVRPDGTALVLDEDEFAALPLSAGETAAARAAVAEVLDLAARRAGPFGTAENTGSPFL